MSKAEELANQLLRTTNNLMADITKTCRRPSRSEVMKLQEVAHQLHAEIVRPGLEHLSGPEREEMSLVHASLDAAQSEIAAMRLTLNQHEKQIGDHDRKIGKKLHALSLTAGDIVVDRGGRPVSIEDLLRDLGRRMDRLEADGRERWVRMRKHSAELDDLVAQVDALEESPAKPAVKGAPSAPAEITISHKEWRVSVVAATVELAGAALQRVSQRFHPLFIYWIRKESE